MNVKKSAYGGVDMTSNFVPVREVHPELLFVTMKCLHLALEQQQINLAVSLLAMAHKLENPLMVFNSDALQSANRLWGGDTHA